tara:strand:- start:1362 stop:1523 length:162 start_codon:yes stop_codon:yes gene_type:complete
MSNLDRQALLEELMGHLVAAKKLIPLLMETPIESSRAVSVMDFSEEKERAIAP